MATGIRMVSGLLRRDQTCEYLESKAQVTVPYLRQAFVRFMGKYLIIHGRIDVFVAGYVRLANVWLCMK